MKMNTEASNTLKEDSKLFSLYLRLTKQKQAIREPGTLEMVTLQTEKIEKSLASRPLPQKIKFYNTLGDKQLKNIYRESFLLLSKNI